ncbi:MAG: DUF5694 domain-containing protein [Acidobacteria bacterium]|nr:DUF5694 domain-containing protein [Acidobacteriota bacterium]MCA1610453.1 DUF5694 domain-containing protein [Acidobacteriota bacterium]
MTLKRLPTALALTLATVSSAVSQPAPAAKPAAPARAEVLVLGVYHMANPGHDIFNTQADDVLAPGRQAEIAQLVAALEKFHPTKIAVEADVYDKRVPKAYADYLAGQHELTRNEIEQIGFRLAKQLGHKAVYPVDADGDFPYQRLVNYAKGSGRTKEFDAISGEIGAMVKTQNEYLASHTILETLLSMNADDKVARDVGFYYRQSHLGEPGDWAGADLVADWFRRNMRIYSNVVQLVDSPTERVLAIFGAGHLGWLRHDFGSDPTLRLRKLAEFAR